MDCVFDLSQSVSVDPPAVLDDVHFSTVIAGGADVTPDQFDWYFYQGRAFGIHVDLNSGTLCSGKMLLGSYMKKPLWVDHSATTVSSPLSLVSFAPPRPSVTSPFFPFIQGFSSPNELGERGHQRPGLSFPSSAGV